MDINFESIVESIVSHFGIIKPSSITQIYRKAWNIDDAYVLKSNENKGELDKSIMLSRFLLSEGVPVIEYINTIEGKPYVFIEENYWSIMKKIRGSHLDPFVGDPKHNGFILGKAVAEIHKALKNIEDKADVYDVDFFSELSSWILPALEKGGISFKDELMKGLYDFRQAYESLPRQLIHRDIHTSNLLFENGLFSGYLDFDMSQRNVRVFDIAYLGCSQLVDNYKDETRLKQWRDIFSGILRGYTGLLPLSEEEMKAIPILFVFDEMLFTAFYLKIGQPEIAKNCAEMTNWLYENIALLIC